MRFKTITYRGGVVTFRIPAKWKESYDPEGGGEFFEDDPDAPTLRLNVLTMKGKSATPESAAAAVARYGEVHTRPDGTSLVRSVRDVEEEGTILRIYSWNLAQALPPKHVRLVVFSLTTLAAQNVDETIALVDDEIWKAKLAPTLGD